jgi:spore coat protein U-like protein
MSPSLPRNLLWAVCVAVLPGAAAAAVSCTVTATGPAFGTYNPLSPTANVANGQVQISCSLTGNVNTNVTVVSSYSTGASGSYATRSMLSGANTLSYNLYKDAAYTQIRGDGTGGSLTSSDTLSLTTTTRNKSTTAVIYGRVPARQDVAAGSYADTITLTITY